ncbi:deoxyhypusine synthase [Anaeramoeba ignava]|uniref:deoxyhypusine synthase n=1 Tax=Anaeramoeba ignava TaxID=1746090 RepID=A0A9Q0LAK6_ANAIG|nr:deoxyhypusine synthase [Anaeramoeba ignava]
MEKIPQIVSQSVLKESAELPDDTPTIQGYDFNEGIDYNRILESYKTTGFQATNFGLAVEEINKMITWRLSDESIEDEKDEDYLAPEVRKRTKCKIFFGYTSNLISSGLREVIRYLVQHRMVDVVVSTAGGVEEDIIKCLGKTRLGDFKLSGKILREKGINRIGNLLVPNKNYCLFEDWIMPILDEMLDQQKAKGIVWSPSSMIRYFGEKINDEQSVLYWAYKNNIPIFCPALTDGSIGDMVFFHSYKNPGLIIDIAQDIRKINDESVSAKKSGMIILGGGLIKHHICNANLMRDGADFSVYINTANEFDGSDAGASPDEAISWGKIKHTASPVKVYADASLVFPLIVAQTFAKHVDIFKLDNFQNDSNKN